MKAIILAAGYSVRLYPLTKDMPKPLIRIAGVPIVERIMDKIKAVKKVNEIFLLTNSKFYSKFEEWLSTYNKKHQEQRDLKITLVDDGTKTNETRLGAIGGVTLVLEKFKIQEDVLITAGDNLFEVDLNKLCMKSEIKKGSVLAVYKFQNIEQVRNRFGVAVVDENDRITEFEEKPDNPKSRLVATAIYVIKKDVLGQFRHLQNKPSEREIHIGEIIPELLKINSPIYCEYLTSWIDIGTKDDIKKADDLYSS